MIIFALILLAACTRTHSSMALQNQEPLRLVGTIPLPNVEGRIDHLDVDVKGQRLFVAALGNNTVEVLDLQKKSHIQSLRGFNEPQGLRYLPSLNRLVVANGGDGAIGFWDAVSFKQIKTVRSAGDADNVRYDAAQHRLYVGYGDGALAVFDENGEPLGDIPLGGHPESFQLEPGAGKAYVNVPARQEIAVIDLNKMRVVGHWPVQGASANYPMALDSEHHRLFVMTRKPPHLLVYDTEAGKLVATLKAGEDSDDVFYDAARQRIYASFGGGTVMSYDQQDADHYQLGATISTAAGARTAFFSSELRQFYLAVPHRGAQPAEIRIYQIEP
jgi:DNA-binding beta-propeller fold protein YncE